MGWRGVLRSAAAAERRAGRAASQHNRAIVRQGRSQLSHMSDGVSRAIARARDFEQKLRANPIAALQLRFEPPAGLVAQPFEITAGPVHGRIALTNGSETFPWIPVVREALVTVMLVDFDVCAFGILAAFRVDNLDRAKPIRFTGWLKKSNPRDSPVYLRDPLNDEVYFPVASDLGGEILPGASRVGILTFEPVRKPTDRLDVHLAGVRLGAAGPVTAQATFAEPRLGGWIQHALATPSLSQQVEYELNRQASAQASALVQHVQTGLVRRTGCAGCMVALCALLIIAASTALAFATTHP
jgi:hypothetical protein